MRSNIISTIILLFIALMANAQTSKLIVNSNIRLPQDSVQSEILITALNDFLIAAQNSNEENDLVLPSEKIETYILLDEINGVEKSGKFEDDHFYKPYLTNIVQLKNEKYLLQISYIGINEGVPLLRASFELIANKDNDAFLFSSPLLRNTKNWETSIVGNSIFHYKDSINERQTVAYEKYTSLFDKKLSSVGKITELYCTENFTELLRLIGVDYKLDYNGRESGTFGSIVGDRKLIVQGNGNASFDSFDPHDLWHSRLSLVISRRLVNRPIDEGCAYLYGGSWGISWEDILARFKTKVANDKNADWADYKENPVDFGESHESRLMVDYVINALIIEKLEREKGFSAVWEFLNCGKYEKGNDNYYKVLEKLTGISKSNYNKKVWKIVNNLK